MSAPRSASIKALRQLSLGSRQQFRQLHMTEPRDIPSRLLVREGSKVSESSKSKVCARDYYMLTSHANPKQKAKKDSSPSKDSKREFNTSRALKSPNDTSTIDFAFLPIEEELGAASQAVRVPILPHVTSPVRNGAMTMPAPDFERVHRVEIVTAAADSTIVAAPSPMTEVHDNESVSVDFHKVADGLKAPVPSAPQAAGFMKQLWNGLMDDVMGPQRKPSLA